MVLIWGSYAGFIVGIKIAKTSFTMPNYIEYTKQGQDGSKRQ